eukprot:PhF_6_TR15070/c0_g1_i2/m.23690
MVNVFVWGIGAIFALSIGSKLYRTTQTSSTPSYPSYSSYMTQNTDMDHDNNDDSPWLRIPNGSPELQGTTFWNDFQREGYRWTNQLCAKDSDGDGVSNGEEVGDPYCRNHTSPGGGGGGGIASDPGRRTSRPQSMHNTQCSTIEKSFGEYRQSSSKQQQQQMKQWTIATYNVEWLFDGVEDPRIAPEHDATHIERVSRVIHEVTAKHNVDTWVLQEVENCHIVRRVVALANLGGVSSNFTAHMVGGTDTATKQNVALITRTQIAEPLYRTENRHKFPIENSKCLRTREGKHATIKPGSSGVTKHFFTSVVLPNFRNKKSSSTVRVGIVGLHLISRPSQTERCVKREAQCAVLMEAIRQRLHPTMTAAATFDPT